MNKKIVYIRQELACTPIGHFHKGVSGSVVTCPGRVFAGWLVGEQHAAMSGRSVRAAPLGTWSFPPILARFTIPDLLNSAHGGMGMAPRRPLLCATATGGPHTCRSPLAFNPSPARSSLASICSLLLNACPRSGDGEDPAPWLAPCHHLRGRGALQHQPPQQPGARLPPQGPLQICNANAIMQFVPAKTCIGI